MSCGLKLPEIVPEPFSTFSDSSTSDFAYNPPSSAFNSGETTEFQSIRERFGSMVKHTGYNWLVIGSILFALNPIILIMSGWIFSVADWFRVPFFDDLLELGCFGCFSYGIYSITNLEPKNINNRLKKVPLAIILYPIINFVSSIILGAILESYFDQEQIGSITIIINGITIIWFFSTFFLLYGSFKFTEWFKTFVTVMQAPYDAQTSRLNWFAIFFSITTGVTAVVWFLIQSDLDTLNSMAYDLAQLRNILLDITMILQVAAGYKIYSVLTNIRKGNMATFIDHW